MTLGRTLRRLVGGVALAWPLCLSALAAGCQDVSVRWVRRDASVAREAGLVRLFRHFERARKQSEDEGPPSRLGVHGEITEVVLKRATGSI